MLLSFLVFIKYFSSFIRSFGSSRQKLFSAMGGQLHDSKRLVFTIATDWKTTIYGFKVGVTLVWLQYLYNYNNNIH